MPGPLEVFARLRKAYGPHPEWWPIDRAYHEREGTDPRFEVCVGAILTQNTSWGNVETAMTRLKEARLLDPRRLARADVAHVREAIRPAGYYNQKTEYLRTFARHVANRPRGLDDVFQGPLARQREMLLSFTGIGPETADDILVYAAGVPSFIIDAYTRRLSKRLGMAKGEEPYEELQALWSKRLEPTAKAYAEAHALIVEHSKRRCTAHQPRCPACPLEGICAQVGVDRGVYGRID